jgi:uncharacterized protein with NRDE domain
MCLILFAYDAHPSYRLLLAANRDEFYERPTAAAHYWDDAPAVFAGRDLRSGGSWLGVTRSGRWAAVTNYRDPTPADPAAPSRGHLVSDFLASEASPHDYLRSLAPLLHLYNGFNLLVGDPHHISWLSNRRSPGEAASVERLEPGVHGLSNHLLNTPWPKVEQGRRDLARLLTDADTLSPEALLSILLDRGHAADHELPDTGVGLDLERALSARFVATPVYGTRSSSAILIGKDGTIHFAERRFDASGRPLDEELHLL